MRIFFPVFQWAKPTMQGVLKKVADQTEAFRQNKADIHTVVYGHHDPEVRKFDGIQYVDIHPQSKRYILQLSEVRKRSFQMAINKLEDLNPDIIYSRYMGGGPHAIRFAKKARSFCPLILEFQAIVTKELAMQKKWAFLAMESLFGRHVIKKANAIVANTHFVKDYYANKYHIPGYWIGNGANIASLPLRTPPTTKDEIHLLFVGSILRWHALDRLIEGLDQYKSERKIILHLVGKEEDNGEIRMLCRERDLENQVIFHGFHKHAELDGFFNESHIAIGCLGFHRKGVDEGSTIKNAEYCARGIPFIHGHIDTDFPDHFQFTQSFPASEDPIPVSEVVSFLDRVMVDPNHPEQMRKYALDHLDWSKKTQIILEIINHLVPQEPGQKA